MKYISTKLLVAAVLAVVSGGLFAEEDKHDGRRYVAMVISPPNKKNSFWARVMNGEVAAAVSDKNDQWKKSVLLLGKYSPPQEGFAKLFYGLDIHATYEVREDGSVEVSGDVEMSAPKADVWEGVKNQKEVEIGQLSKMGVTRQFSYTFKEAGSRKVVLKMRMPMIGHTAEEVELPLTFHVFDQLGDCSEFFDAWQKRGKSGK